MPGPLLGRLTRGWGIDPRRAAPGSPWGTIWQPSPPIERVAGRPARPKKNSTERTVTTNLSQSVAFSLELNVCPEGLLLSPGLVSLNLIPDLVG